MDEGKPGVGSTPGFLSFRCYTVTAAGRLPEGSSD